MKDKKLHAKAKEIATILGWHCETNANNRHYAKLLKPEGSGVILHMGYKPRIEITGVWPEAVHAHGHTRNFHPFNARPVITVAFGRSAEVIAKDIQRRFLPKYLPLFEEQAQLRQSVLDDITHRRQLGERLANEMGWEYREHRNEVHFHIGETWGDFEISGVRGREFDISLKGISERLTLRIAQLIGEALS